ncbi:MAG: arylesterase [Saccharospirillum sp.]|nr:arylesterase [Saccharospirillum sp.]
MRRIALVLTLVLLVSGLQANTLLVMGDSLSAGYGMSPEETWVALMEERLQDNDQDIQVVNASISGETSMGGLQRLPALLERHQPDIVLLELGANDGLRGFPIAGIQENLASMIEISHQANADVIILGIRIPPNFGSRYTEPFFNQFADLAEQYDLLYLPFLLDGVAEYHSLMQADGLHPKAEAQPIILENVWPLVEKALGQRSP